MPFRAFKGARIVVAEFRCYANPVRLCNSIGRRFGISLKVMEDHGERGMEFEDMGFDTEGVPPVGARARTRANGMMQFSTSLEGGAQPCVSFR